MINSNLKSKKFGFIMSSFLLGLLSLSLLLNSSSTLTYTQSITDLDRELSNEELVDLLELAMQIEPYSILNSEDLPYGYDLDKINKIVSEDEYILVTRLDSAVKLSTDTALSNNNLFELDLDISPWDQLFHKIKDDDLEELLRPLGEKYSSMESSSELQNIKGKVTSEGNGVCQWWEGAWCRCGGGFFNHHPTPQWTSPTWFSSYTNAKNYAISLGFRATPDYATYFTQNPDYPRDWTKEDPVGSYGCWPREALRIHGFLNPQNGDGNNPNQQWSFAQQNIPRPGVSAAKGVEPNPIIGGWWNAFMPGWWIPYVLDWHNHH
ncbi:MAG: hypothetical protein HeimC3_49720 [Candidatus Heimdallarchaeota archaeon LC_3]|nr:MAG: hypothetical protein HeimC3_49720 [Candidatus Heimdallarchaeota archaeon LC_3]